MTANRGAPGPRSFDDWAASVDGLAPHRNQPTPKDLPAAYRPGAEIDHGAGEATYVGQSFAEPISLDEAQILQEMGLRPEAWELQHDTVQVRKWQMPTSHGDLQWCWYYRVTAIRRRNGPAIDEFVDWVRSRKVPKPATKRNDGTQLWCTSDWQVGKAGTVEALERLQQLPDLFTTAWKQAGRPGEIVVVFGGDLGEGCAHHYPGQTFQIELNEREQRRIIRELAYRIVDKASRLVPEVRVVTVGGNHGEVRKGKADVLTDVSDNRDVAVIEDVRFAMRDHDRWSHVDWLIPRDDLTVLFEAAGVPVVVAHGHQFGRNNADKVRGWWNEQAGNDRPAGYARLLISGHYHHLVQHWFGPRTWVQLPCEDAGSPSYAERRGEGDARPGSVTVDLADGEIGDLRVV